jgi:hypothetical protein
MSIGLQLFNDDLFGDELFDPRKDVLGRRMNQNRGEPNEQRPNKYSFRPANASAELWTVYPRRRARSARQLPRAAGPPGIVSRLEWVR